ncbi:MAG TPA: AsmA-like C-terminal domain-containing protein [Burkholderiales bacterium]
MKPFRRVLIGGLALSCAFLLVIVAALLSAPLWIDSAAVKNEIASLLSRATGDVVELDRLQLHLFPPVSVEVARPRYTVADVTDLTAESVIVDLNLWNLITGKVQPRRIRLNGVVATIRFPASAPENKPASLATIEQQLRAVLTKLTQAAPGLTATADDATITVHLSDRPPFMLKDVDARMSTSGSRIDGNISFSSDVWERISLTFSIMDESLQGTGRLDFVGLNVGGLQDLIGMDASLPRAEAALIGRIDWQMRGLSDLKAEAVASTSRMTIQRNGAAQEIRGIVVAAGLERRGSALKLSVHRLYAQAPSMLLSADLSRDERGHHELEVNVSGADLVALQAAARSLAAEIPWISKPPALLRTGTLTALQLDSSGDSLEELFDLPVLRGEASVEGVTLDIVRPALTLSGVGGRIAIDHGDLQVRNATAVVGKSVLRNGQFALRIEDGTATDLRAEALMDLDLGETIALAKRLIRRKDIDIHLDAVQKLEGKTLAHVILWGDPQAPQASVEMSRLALFAEHRDVPLPLRLRGGQFTYAGGAIALRDATGEFGRSAFENLSASLALSPPYRFEVTQHSASLSLDELYAAASNVTAFKPAMSEIRSLSGKASVSELRAEGNLRAPEATHFRAIVSPHNVKLLAQRMDSDILLDGGSIEISDRLVNARDVSLNAMDSALRISARTENYRTGIRAVDADINGDLGAATLARIYQLGRVAPAMQLRAPLHFADSKVAWKENGDVSFNGKVKAAGTIDLEIVAAKAGSKLDLDRLALKDASSEVILSGEYAGENINAAFKGKLTGTTLADLLVQPPVSLEGIEGDMQADLRVRKPWITRVQGRFEGSAIAIPGDSAIPLKVDHVILTANGKKLSVEQAILSVGDSRMEIKGNLHRDNDKIVLDANLRSDRIVLSKALMDSQRHTEDSEPAFQLSDLPVTGRIGLDVRILETERVTLAPVVADVAVAGENLDVRIIEAALCGITMSGMLQGQLEDMRLAGGLTARKADMQKSIACLTRERVVGSGLLDVDATFTAQGALTMLGERLDGEFTATARDGNIEEFDILNRIFAFLNVTELVRGQKLGVGQGLPYRSARVTGSFAGTAVHIKEADLDGPTVHIVTTGRIDYGSGALGMDVLVAPLQTANAVVDRIPIIKRIFGGTVLALPVQVLGTVQNPIVVPLGPGAVASRMTSIIANTLRLPIDAVKVLSPNAPATQEPGR